MIVVIGSSVGTIAITIVVVGRSVVGTIVVAIVLFPTSFLGGSCFIWGRSFRSWRPV